MTVSLLCLIGLPGSGKTTLAASLKGIFVKHGASVACIEYDSLIVDSQWAQGEWKRQRQKILEDVRRFAAQLKGQVVDGSVSSDSVVILDDNFYYRSMRYEVYRIAKELRMGFAQFFLDVPFELCCSRNSSRPQPVPSEVLFRMKSLMEPPEPSRNPWEKHSLVLSNSPDQFEDVFRLVADTWRHPCFPVDSSVPCSPPQVNSVVHYADLALRRIVRSMVLSVPREQRSSITDDLLKKKKSVLEDLQLGNIELPLAADPLSDLVTGYVRVLEPYFSDLLHK